ncbi:hypothetical protein MYSTI_07468 [Myxococcus stipitatus DSM 14675]|uniref:Lipoprotein n=1 Tax=Myxococcus stipitatus (strain DSM 14675 / JCM 12634 / Mx s8) TaxID=1278073 RepID=L7ULF0_MYXSD|nr:hypothetical protein [Myxococcus stipitatus]AGC48740.1 hypothetical protein MYSTI_07468 [Myxococcus stipitatus DSM 14675]
MALKTALTTLALGTLFLGSSTALAEDGSMSGWATQEARRRDDRNSHPDTYEAHVHNRYCDHAPAPRPAPRARGRYELQTVNRWVDGRYEQVWVPEVCRERHGRRGHHSTRCRGGYYENRWVPGRYEQSTEWVWVSYERGNNGGWSSGRTHAASYVR